MKPLQSKNERKEVSPDETLDDVRKEIKKKEIQINILKKLLKPNTNH